MMNRYKVMEGEIRPVLEQLSIQYRKPIQTRMYLVTLKRMGYCKYPFSRSWPLSSDPPCLISGTLNVPSAPSPISSLAPPSHPEVHANSQPKIQPRVAPQKALQVGR